MNSCQVFRSDFSEWVQEAKTVSQKPISIARELGLTILRPLTSKKNDVFLVSQKDEKLVLKVYRPQFRKRASREWATLEEAFSKGLPVPQPLAYFRDSALLLTYITGENLCDAFNSAPSSAYVQALARWYSNFHLALARTGGQCVLKGDSILKNFVLSWKAGNTARPQLYGVDFEESIVGDPAQDVGEICASILNTDPMFTEEKTILCQELVNTYVTLTGYPHRKKIIQAIAAALHITAQWRPRQRDYLLKQAAAIAAEGLHIHPAT
jgi:aminoglycoside phosphotransferase (APT) family kinase protein